MGPSGTPMSISATNASVLSGATSRYRSSRSRSAVMSALVRSTSNCLLSSGSAGASPTVTDARG